MFPVFSQSYSPDGNDDLDIDFSQFELRPRQETSNPLFFDDDSPPSGFLGDGIPSRGVRQPLPTTWSPPVHPGHPPDIHSGFHPPQLNNPPPTSFLPPDHQMGYSPYPTDSRTGSHFPQNINDQNFFAGGGRPSSPCESISDRFTAAMLSPPDEPPRRPGIGQNDGQFYTRPSGREQPPTQDHYRPEDPPQSQYYPAPMHHRHDEHRPYTQPLDRAETAPNRHPPPRSYSPPSPHRQGYSSPRQDYSPQNEQHSRLPPRDFSNPRDYRTVPRPPTPPLMPEARSPTQSSPRDTGHRMLINGGPPGAINPPKTKEESFPSRGDNAFRKTLPTNAERPAQPLLAPEQKRRSHSFRGERSQQHHEERSRTLSIPARKLHEKIRDFVPYNPKAPSTPLPDYEEEATCEYIPQPDYEDDEVRAYVPRPDYGAGEIRAYVPRPDYLNNRN